MSDGHNEMELADMLSNLSRMPVEDREWILGQLDSSARQRVDKALAASPGPKQNDDAFGLSDWLAAKISNGEGMTSNAHQALISCANDLMASISLGEVPSHGPSLLGRLAAFVRGRAFPS